jgi:hypothetical protein
LKSFGTKFSLLELSFRYDERVQFTHPNLLFPVKNSGEVNLNKNDCKEQLISSSFLERYPSNLFESSIDEILLPTFKLNDWNARSIQ